MATRWATTSTASAIHATLWSGFRAMARTILDIKADAVEGSERPRLQLDGVGARAALTERAIVEHSIRQHTSKSSMP